MPFDGSNYESPVTNPVTELLENAWRRIDKPQKWTRGQPETVDGRRQCSLNALQTAAWDCHPSPGSYVAALSLLGFAMHGNIMGFNDTHSHRAVGLAWQHAITTSRSLS